MKVLHITPSFYPATYWGGPIFSTKAICDGIAAQPDVSLRVLTTDAAGPARTDRVRRVPMAYPVHYAQRVAGHSFAPGLLAQLPAAVAWADVVHLTGAYSFPTLPALALARIMDRPLVWSPRGALQATQEWAAAPNRAIKRMFERSAQILRPSHAVLHTTAACEEAASTVRLQGMTTAVIPNCVSIPPAKAQQMRGHKIKLMYIGRLHPKKGLDRLFAAMADLPDHITLDVYGSGAARYTADLERKAWQTGGRIRMRGHVDGATKTMAFWQADLCVFPSYSENFGITVAEALAHGVPVLTTTAMPWQGVETHGCGAWVDLRKCSLAAEISTLLARDLVQMGMAGRAWMTREFSPQAMVGSFMALYRSLFDSQPQGVLV